MATTTTDRAIPAASDDYREGAGRIEDNAITAEGLVKRFGEVEALAGIDLAVPTGTVLGLLGPNGAGKTTAVRIFATILRPDAGVARILGTDVAKDPAFVRGRIGLAGQYAAVDENLTGRENLRLMGRLTHLRRDVGRRRADDLLDRMDLAGAADRPVRTCSGACAARSTWPPPSSTAHRCCSSTSRRPVLTRRAAGTSS